MNQGQTLSIEFLIVNNIFQIRLIYWHSLLYIKRMARSTNTHTFGL
jgi:hypothetical protein